ncbi:helix-turn-helix transcriptional regulator [Nigerium massiliense]|uniref:helix-turn-helix transcriptional regulator n=1 Tax=Nigerium massiliense TaxID=1522317 RepID=UPI00058EBC34|nr:helix-turn-helix transcriptional regulator [Nigerium massiliense]
MKKSARAPALCEARADYEGVEQALRPLREPWAAEWVSQPGWWPWADVYGNALVVLGQLDEADAFLHVHEQRAEAARHAPARGRLAYVRGRLLGQRGDLDAAEAAFARAVDLLAPTALRYDQARVHFAHGRTLRRAGRRAEAERVLALAGEAFAELGATAYVERCAGDQASATSQTPTAALTPQELAVATLVPRGQTNKEVAAELFLSVKTVRYHLTRVYAKLTSGPAPSWSPTTSPGPSSDAADCTGGAAPRWGRAVGPGEGRVPSGRRPAS